MKPLTILANKYQSDKGTEYSSKHGFSDIYDDYFISFKNKLINILEIGVHDGSSLKMWYEYFPNANIIGLDIDDKAQFNNDRISCGILDQSEKDHLEYFVKNTDVKFDIILDDGSHHISDQQITFGHLFPLLNSSGIYIIEDLHTSLCEPDTMVYGRFIENNLEKTNTTLYYLNNSPYNSTYLTQEQNQYIQENIQSVKIFESYNEYVPHDYKHKSITSVIIKK